VRTDLDVGRWAEIFGSGTPFVLALGRGCGLRQQRTFAVTPHFGENPVAGSSPPGANVDTSLPAVDGIRSQKLSTENTTLVR
jgi:hypothetical protein